MQLNFLSRKIILLLCVGLVFSNLSLAISPEIKLIPQIKIESNLNNLNLSAIIKIFSEQKILLTQSQINQIDKIYSANETKISYVLGDTIYLQNSPKYNIGDMLYIYGDKHALHNPNDKSFWDNLWVNDNEFSFELVGIAKVISYNDSIMELNIVSLFGSVQLGELVFTKNPSEDPSGIRLHYAPNKIEALPMIIDDNNIITGSYVNLFINKGSDDGVTKGDIFGIYQDSYQNYSQNIGDFLAYQTYPKYSLGVILFTTKDVLINHIKFISRVQDE